MRRFTSALSIAALCVCFSAMNGCGEDNEAAIKEQMAKSTGSVDSSKTISPSQNMADYAKNNPGMNPSASSGKALAGSKAPYYAGQKAINGVGPDEARSYRLHECLDFHGPLG